MLLSIIKKRVTVNKCERNENALAAYCTVVVLCEILKIIMQEIEIYRVEGTYTWKMIQLYHRCEVYDF
jgi:hypothetical protein